MRLSLLLLIFYLALLPSRLFSQCTSPCLTNGNFKVSCTDVQYAGNSDCSAFTTACGDGWLISHGTPEITLLDINKVIGCQSWWGAFMWGMQTQGEGMYTPYSFQSGQAYDVQLTYSVEVDNVQTGTDGYINLYAANGLTPSKLTGCGEPIPTPSGSQLIQQIPVTGSTSGTVTYTFTANSNYAQLWMYPSVPSTTNSTVKLNLLVTSIFCCPSCRNVVYYNTGNVPVAVQAGDVYAGSTAGSGGSGTVGVVSTAATTVVAGDAIYMLPNFQAVVSDSGSYTATIVPCGQSGTTIDPSSTGYYDSVAIGNASFLDSIATGIGRITNDGVKATQQEKVLTAEADSSSLSSTPAYKFQIYPTVTSGLVNITGSPADLSNAAILVTDETGRVVYQTYNEGGTSMSLNLGNLRSGLYFLQYRSSTRTTTQKIIVRR